MTITTDLSQSRVLRDLGAPQDTEFIWYEPRLPHEKYVAHKTHYHHCDDRRANIASYTLTELLEWAVSNLGAISVSLATDGVSYASIEPAGTKAIRHFGGDSPIDALMNLITSVTKGKEA